MALPPSHNNWLDTGNTNESIQASISRSIKDNDTNTLQHLLETFKNASLPFPVVNDKSESVLHLAASNRQSKECLELLLKYSDSKLLDINQEWTCGTALHAACLFDCEENALMLLRKGCDPYKVISGTKETALQIAAAHGLSKIVEYLLNYYPDNINESQGSRLTALHLASYFNHPKIALMLLDRGANVLLIDREGCLPLHYACGKYFDIMRLLVKHDLTSVNRQEYRGLTPLMITLAAEEPRDMIIEMVHFLLESGAKTNFCDDEGRMALHYATSSGNPQLLQYVLEHTETSSIKKWFRNIPNVVRARNVLHSLIGRAIRSRSMECLEILLSSDKLPKYILQAPFVYEKSEFSTVICSPLALIFKSLNYKKKKLIFSYLQLLLKYDAIMLDKFISKIEIEWPRGEVKFSHPFSKIFNCKVHFSKYLDYFYWLNENNITIDYCLQYYHDNTKPFATFTGYKNYYKLVIAAYRNNEIEALKLLIYNSDILEPDQLLIQFNAENEGNVRFHHFSRVVYRTNEESRKNIYRYLIYLKPIYYRLDQLCNKAGSNELSWYPYSTASEEFSKCRLQQLCRTTIRQHVRKYTLQDNLRDFRRDILQLPLPTLLKDYLLFKY